MGKKEKIFIVIFLMGLIVVWEFWGDFFKYTIFYDKLSKMENLNKYSVKVSNKNWTWDYIIFYKCAFPGMRSRERESSLAFKMSNTLYLKDKPIGKLFDINFENEELKLIFALRDDIKIKSNSYLEQRGRDFVIIENPMGVYDDKKEFKYIENNNAFPYENNEFFRIEGSKVIAKRGVHLGVVLNCFVYIKDKGFLKEKEKI